MKFWVFDEAATLNAVETVNPCSPALCICLNLALAPSVFIPTTGVLKRLQGVTNCINLWS